MVDITETQQSEIFIQALHGRKYGGRLESWHLFEFKNPDNGDTEHVAYGYCYGDPMRRWKEGSNMRSTLISSINLEENFIVTRNTVYILGDKATDEVADRLMNGLY